MECRVYNSPKTVAEETIGDFLLNLNDWGEIEISTKYENFQLATKYWGCYYF